MSGCSVDLQRLVHVLVEAVLRRRERRGRNRDLERLERARLQRRRPRRPAGHVAGQLHARDAERRRRRGVGVDVRRAGDRDARLAPTASGDEPDSCAGTAGATAM